MTRWRASAEAERIEVASVLPVVAEMHIVGRPTSMAVGDVLILARRDERGDLGSIIGVPSGHAVARMNSGRTFLLRPRIASDPASGLPPTRGKPTSEWVVEQIT